ncbi:MAG TPA: hypothetical protein ENG95_01370 [Nitrospirae bacterium]|nr:vanZ like family protein [bacterium BMS3Abin10]GBE37636.1 vanZ like family protein [bacterium BMS3Bbin08]HDH50716.1 hypothetical protein [Nitrospirota bacterium]HDK16836.1 hypothetical protein [Nitrospirota bacterium]HDK81710.1 hypothetical protein [Nitrospirota bacterium]
MGKIKAVISSWVFWFVTIAYMRAVFYLSSRPATEMFVLPGNFDKALHFGVYAGLAFLIHISMKKSSIKKNVFFISVSLAVIYGVANELYQMRVPGRDASVADVLANCLGAFLGGYSAGFIHTKKSV